MNTLINFVNEDGTKTKIGEAKDIDVTFVKNQENNVNKTSRMLRYGGFIGEVTFIGE